MTPLVTYVRGRHASSDSMIIVPDGEGKRTAIRNLSTRISPTTTEISQVGSGEGTVCLRVDDKERSDFWMEFNHDVATLEMLLAKAKNTVSETDQ